MRITKAISRARRRLCRFCSGTGRLHRRDAAVTCGHCRGVGRVAD